MTAAFVPTLQEELHANGREGTLRAPLQGHLLAPGDHGRARPPGDGRLQPIAGPPGHEDKWYVAADLAVSSSRTWPLVSRRRGVQRDAQRARALHRARALADLAQPRDDRVPGRRGPSLRAHAPSGRSTGSARASSPAGSSRWRCPPGSSSRRAGGRGSTSGSRRGCARSRADDAGPLRDGDLPDQLLRLAPARLLARRLVGATLLLHGQPPDGVPDRGVRRRRLDGRLPADRARTRRSATSQRMAEDFQKGIRLILIINIPAAVGLALLSRPDRRGCIYMHGHVQRGGRAGTWRSACPFMAIGLPFFSVVNLTVRAFYAVKDTRPRCGWRWSTSASTSPSACPHPLAGRPGPRPREHDGDHRADVPAAARAGAPAAGHALRAALAERRKVLAGTAVMAALSGRAGGA